MTSHVGRNYARALFELAAETGSPEAVGADLRVARDALFTQKDVRNFLSNRLISRVTKKKLVRAGFENEANPRVLTLLFLLIDRGRTRLLGEIEEEFERLFRLSRGVRKVKVYSAFPLGDAEKGSITRSLETRLAARVELETDIRPSLIGGVVAESEGQEIEFSIKSQLGALAAGIEAAGPGER
ncbi:MAG: ATP synthase F1 subunit delta [Spirochaetia bacterium]|jgi:F-type H+-transporting ATPase subunit delta